MVTIKIIDNIYAQITDGLEHVQKILEYEAEYWTQGKFRKERQVYIKKAHKNGKILAGLVPYIEEYCKKQKIDCEVHQKESYIPTLDNNVILPGIILRPEQVRMVQSVLKKHRGILKGFTGLGKSYILSAILKHYPSAKFLVLVHTKGLVNQLYESFLEFGLDVGRLTGEFKELDHKITVGTINSCVKYKWDVDGVFVDECHHISGEKTRYAKLLSNIDVGIRIGFSATPKEKKDASGYFTSMGLLGPIIDEVDLEEGKEKGLISPVRLKFIKVPINYKVGKITNFNTFVDVGIVNNNRRNKLVIKQAYESSKENKSGLILITKTEHGKILQELAKTIFDWNIPFVYGNTSTEERDIIKNKLKNKEILCVIASVVFTEGINIESLDSLYLGDVGKKESKILQCIGRGLRVFPRKYEIAIFDFLDLSSKYSVKQLGERLFVYSENEWL